MDDDEEEEEEDMDAAGEDGENMEDDVVEIIGESCHFLNSFVPLHFCPAMDC